MDKYQCHKIVEAGLLHHFEGDVAELTNGERIQLRPGDGERIGRMIKGKEWVAKENDGGGGYLVRYADGYFSWSPGDVFKAGYTKLAG